MSKKCPYNKSVLVTGASSGIGMETADLFAMNGFKVYAASRHPRKTDNPSIVPIEMDVTDEKSVERAAREIGELGVIVHCAGFGISGSAEMAPADRVRAQMETNYFGVLNVNRVFMPLLRRNRRSLVLITGSIAGLVPIPYQSHYSSSKYALEAYGKALRMEAGQFGVKVTVVEPGDTKTGFTKARTSDEPEGSPYFDQCRESVAKMAKDEQSGKPANTVANVFLRLAFRKNPPVSVAVGFEYKAIALLARILPTRLVNWLVKLIYIG